MRKILAIGAIQAHNSFEESIKKPLHSLIPDSVIEVLDPLALMKDGSNQEYYSLWGEFLLAQQKEYDAFFGFSFGGMILQQCLSLFHDEKPIVLFSTPTVINKELFTKLHSVVTLCEENRLFDALNLLYELVYFPHNVPVNVMNLIQDEELAKRRMIFGLKRVLSTDALPLLKNNKVLHYHLFGAVSQLVNTDNIADYPKCNLIMVPQSGMHVLSDNPVFCKNTLAKILDL